MVNRAAEESFTRGIEALSHGRGREARGLGAPHPVLGGHAGLGVELAGLLEHRGRRIDSGHPAPPAREAPRQRARAGAEVLVEGDTARLIRRREDFADLWSQELDL